MVVVDDLRRYVAANPAALALLGVPEHEVLRMRIDDLTPADQRHLVPELWEAFMRDGSQTGRYSLALPGGRMVEVELSATANVLPGQHLSIFVTAPSTEAAGDGSEGALTGREREVLGLIAMGNTGPEIAEELGISPKTVAAHMGNILEKLGARTRAQAIALAIQSGDLTLPAQG